MKEGRLKEGAARLPMLETLQRQNAILKSVSYAAERFLGSEPIESVLTDVLEHLGKAAEVGSATALEFVNDPVRGTVLVPRYSWTTAGAQSVFDYAPQGFPSRDSDFEHLLVKLKEGNPLVARTSELPAGLQALLSGEVRTLAALPIFATGELVGVIALSQRWTEREWSDAEIGALKTAATVIGAALERSQSRRAVQKRDELLRLFVDNAPIMVAYFDKKMRCRFANLRYSEFFGFTGRGAIGKSLEEILGAENHALSLPYVRRAYEGEQVAFERPHPDRDGSIKHLEIEAVPHFDETGAVIACYAILSDITERKRNEEELQRVAAENESILENTVAGIAFFKNRQIVRCNKSFAELFGYGVDELQGMSAKDLHVSEEFFLSHGEHFYPVLQKNGHITGTLQHRRKDGSLFWGQYSATVLDHADISKGVIVVLHDSTEQRNAEAALLQAHDHLEEKVRKRTEELAALNRELEAYSYSVSHDLRAPLRAIDGFTHLLEEQLTGKLDQETETHLGKIRSAVQRMFRLIESLMELGRATRKEMTVREVNLSEYASEIVDEIAAQNSSRKAEFVIESDIKANGDPHLLRLLLQNLLENAWKYTSKIPAARIEFGTTIASSGRKYYWLRDNGAGFDMAYATRLFQPFQRLHSAHEFEGTGIGLATVARIARRHGGEAWAESEVGMGATFMFSLAD